MKKDLILTGQTGKNHGSPRSGQTTHARFNNFAAGY